MLQWEAASGTCTGEFGTETKENTVVAALGNACFNDVALLADDTVAVVSDDGLIRTGILSAEKACWQHQHTPQAGRILMNAITTSYASPKNKAHDAEIITGTHDQSLQRFSHSANGIQQTLAIKLQQGPINCLCVAHHAEYQGHYFVACYTGVILQVDRDGQVLGEIRVHENAVKALALHPTQPIGVSCSADGVLASWDLSGKPLRQYPGHLAIIDDVDISPDGQRIASVGRDFTLKIHGLEDGALQYSISLGRRSPKAVAFVDNDIVIVTNYWGELLRVEVCKQRVTRQQIAQNGISGIAIRGHELVVSSYDGAVYLVRADDLHLLNALRSMTQRVDGPAFLYC